jgi:hypothetical protein
VGPASVVVRIAETRAQAAGDHDDIALVVIGVVALVGVCYLAARPWVGYRLFLRFSRKYEEVRARPEREAFTPYARFFFALSAVFMVVWLTIAIVGLIDPDLLRS